MNPIKKQIIETGKWIMEKGLTWGTSGNISAMEEDRIYLTASGTVLGNLSEEDIIVCDRDGQVLEGDKKPSKETAMHLRVYQGCGDARAVVHTSPFYATFLSCCRMEVKTNLFIESMYYTENIQRVPYFHAGSVGLAEAVGAVCEKTHVLLLEHHGILVYDKSLAECRTALEVTENVCKMNLFARMGAVGLEELPEETVREFLEGGYFKKRR